jgi:molybdopterin converting factor small subunit
MFRFAYASASALAIAEAGKLAITYEDCGAKHAHVDDLQPSSIRTGRRELITGTGTSDEDVTSANFKATVSALGAKLSECSGDGTKDIVCNLPMGVGKITVKALDFPLPKGTVSIPVEVKTTPLLPASLAHVDVHIEATEQNDESIICLDVHTTKTASDPEPEPAPIAAEVTGTLGITYEDCGAKHAHVDDLQPSSIQTGRKEVITGTGTSDEDVTSANFKATVSALGAQLSECSGDGTKDIVCNLPMGVGKITVKALDFPLPKGAVSIPVEVETSAAIPPSHAIVDVHIEATEQNHESIICLDVHTAASASASEPHLAKSVEMGVVV